jgi:hypothetical protein
VPVLCRPARALPRAGRARTCEAQDVCANFTQNSRSSVLPGGRGVAASALVLAAGLALAAAGFAAEPPPAGQAAQNLAPIGSRQPSQETSPAGARPSSSGWTVRDVVGALESTHAIRIWLDGAIPAAAPSGVDPTGLSAEATLRQAFRSYDLFLGCSSMTPRKGCGPWR